MRILANKLDSDAHQKTLSAVFSSYVFDFIDELFSKNKTPFMEDHKRCLFWNKKIW
jgi:hypothetical protein